MNSIYFEAKGESLLDKIGMTKAEFARRMGIHRQNVKALFKTNDLRIIRKAADVMAVPFEMLVGYVEPIDLEDFPSAFESSEGCAEVLVEDIPTGNSPEDRRARQRLIQKFYKQWMTCHPDSCVRNESLNDNIYVQYISVHETAGQASLTYLSTLAVLQLDTVLKNAVTIGETVPKRSTKSQKPFVKILLMSLLLPGIGRVKLTVGVKKSDGTKVQYCVTAVSSEPQKRQPR